MKWDRMNWMFTKPYVKRSWKTCDMSIPNYRIRNHLLMMLLKVSISYFSYVFWFWPFWNFQWAFWGPESGPVAKHFVIFIKKKVFYFYIFVIQPCHAPDVITNWCYLIYFWYIKILFKWLRRISRLKMTCTTSQPWPSHVLSQPAHPPR